MTAILITVIIILILITYTITISLDSGNYYEYISKSNYKLSNRRLAELLNGNVMSNLPNIITNSKHETVCATSIALYLSPLTDNLLMTDDYELHNDNISSVYDKGCEKLCPDLSLESLIIRDSKKQEIYINNKQLYDGIWCIKKRPNCNLRTTFAIMTMNGSAVCNLKFPNLFGGPEGNKIIACNNTIYSDPNNVLMDYKQDRENGERVDTRTIIIEDEDELLDNNNTDKSYRFRCLFNGTDSIGNKYIAHPASRFHPIRNPCTMHVPNAHPSIVFNSSEGTCDCGTKQSRVENVITGDTKSRCSSCKTAITMNTEGDTEIGRLKIRDECFVSDAKYLEARHKLPCFLGVAGKTRVPCQRIFDLKIQIYNPILDSNPYRWKMPLFPKYRGKNTNDIGELRTIKA
ncbi:per os infectivity factor pif-2 [Microplitis demolitor]|uniref:per os infectivity factor pif-2 n=1 Tax=Microplitis demolitor TaxID=69319 RepID=UPI0004400362|nr:per os infectivity factor pif-2 [Microplitis demolitor]KAG6558461.1 per os infectivity factor pif-2 [Microplitis demolitor]